MSEVIPKLLLSFPGRNNVERAIAYRISTESGFAALSWSEQVRAGGELAKQLESNPSQVRLSNSRVFGAPVATDLNGLKENGPATEGEPVESEDDSDDEEFLSAAKNLVEELTAALKSGDVKAIRARLTKGQEAPLPANEEERRKAIQACAGPNDIAQSMTFLMSHPRTRDRFGRVPVPLRPFCAGKFLRQGDVEWNEVFR